jgi:signal transduction histidine kinase
MSAPLHDRLIKTYALAWVMLGLGLCLTVAAAWSLFAKVRALDEDRFQRQVGQTVEALRDRLDKYGLALTGLADFAASRPSLTRAEWNFRVRLLLPEKSYPGLLELGLLEAGPTPHTQPGGAQTLSASSEDTNTFQLQHAWVCPPSAFDGLSPRFLSDPVVRQTAHAAFRSGAPAFCYRRELATEIAGKPARGFTIFVPFLEPRLEQTPTIQASPATPQPARPREPHSQGVAFGSIEPNLLLGNLFGTAPRELGFDLFCGQPLSAKTWLNVSGQAPPTLSPGLRPYLRTKFPLQFHTQDWTLILYTTPLFERESSRYRPWTAIVVGTTLSFLVSALLFLQIHARLRQESVAAELRLAYENLQRVQNERERIGRDIHDGAIQSLYGLQLTLGHYDRLRVRQPQEAGKVFEQCRTTVDALIAELRTFIVEQVPEQKGPAALLDPALTLREVVQRFQSASPIPIRLHIHEPAPPAVSQTQEAHLRQIAQEAISNSLRHGHPRQIKVDLECRNQHLRLRVLDDGGGFELARSQSTGHGLANMQARAAQLGGTLLVEAQPGRGTQITLEISQQQEYAPAHV